MQAFNKNFKEIILTFTFNHLMSNSVTYVYPLSDFHILKILKFMAMLEIFLN